MARIICIDYGGKRTGIAVTDPLQIIATALTTVPTNTLLAYLQQYIQQESVERILIGEPKHLDDSNTDATYMVHGFVKVLQKHFPTIPVEMVDERYTSKLASQSMIAMGMKKKDRQQKGNVDQIAATIMLQEWLANR